MQLTGLNVSALLGKTLSSVRNEDNERIQFVTSEGEKFALYHDQDCCESVRIEDIAGDLADLVGSPITKAEEVTSNENPAGAVIEGTQDSFTWTYYHLATVKGYVTIRWYGESNGYYSESVTFAKVG